MAPHVSDQYLGAGMAVTVSFVVIQLYAVILAHTIQLVADLGEFCPANPNCAEVSC